MIDDPNEEEQATTAWIMSRAADENSPCIIVIIYD